jgi:hypothetical protein
VCKARCGKRFMLFLLTVSTLHALLLSGQGSAQNPPASDSLSFAFEVRGTITSPDGLMDSVPVVLTALGDSSEILWQSVAVTDPAGRYRLAYVGQSRSRPARFEISTPRYRAAGSDHVYGAVTNQWTTAAASGAPAATFDIRLSHSADSYGFALLLLIPALAGSLVAVLHMWGFGHVKNDHITILYVSSAVLFWAVVNLRLAAEFMLTGTREIVLFDPSLRVPISVPIFAFLGVFVYATYSVLEKDYAFFTSQTPDELRRRGILLAIGNRLFSAPYLAIIAVLILFRDGPSLLVPFVAFFTGLWIEIIVGALGEVGTRMSPVRAGPAPTPAVPKTGGGGGKESAPGDPTEASG